VTVDNSSEKGLSPEAMGANIEKELNDLKRACDKHNSIEKKKISTLWLQVLLIYI
jgi:hypothetical protein